MFLMNVTRFDIVLGINGSMMNESTGIEHGIPRDIRTSIVLLVSVLIIGSNILNLCVLRVTHQIPAISRLCLMNLSCADLAVGLVACAPSVYPAITGRWPYGVVCCQIAGITHGMSVTVSIWSLAMVSVDRYVAIIHPLQYRSLLTRYRCKVVLLLMWLLAFCTFFAPLPTKENFVYYQYNPEEGMCAMHWEYPWFCFATAVYIPVFSGLILLVSTIRVSREIVMLQKRREQFQQNTSQPLISYTTRSQNSHSSPCVHHHNRHIQLSDMHACESSLQERNSQETRTGSGSVSRLSHVGHRLKVSHASTNLRDLKVVKVLSITSLVYFSAWGPYVAQVVLYAFMPTLTPQPALMFSFLWLANSNSFMNVIIYSVMYASFRRTIMKALTKCIPE